MLIKLEIFLFFATFLYIIYFFLSTVLYKYQKYLDKVTERERKRKLREKSHGTKAAKKLQKLQEEESQDTPQELRKSYVTPEVSEQIREIIKRVEVNISRGYLESAQSLIVEGLTLKKNDRDLNLLLADVYERENKFQNAEFIYRDLLDEHEDDEYILQRLGNIYSLRNKLDKAFSCYEKCFRQNRSNIDVIDILSHLAIELEKYKKAASYAGEFLKQKPRDTDKLGIKAYAHEKRGDKHEALKYYRLLLDLQPYNKEVKERLEILES